MAYNADYAGPVPDHSLRGGYSYFIDATTCAASGRRVDFLQKDVNDAAAHRQRFDCSASRLIAPIISATSRQLCIR
ncbi:MAG: hypothetical protein U0T77_01865 [Chitinophagales bacterium]